MERKEVCYEAVARIIDLMLERPRRKREDATEALVPYGCDVDGAISFLKKKKIINVRSCTSDAGEPSVELGFRPNTYFIIFDMSKDNWRCLVSAAKHKPKELAFRRYSQNMTFTENFFSFIADATYALRPYNLCRVLALIVIMPYGERIPERVTVGYNPSLFRAEVKGRALLTKISECMKRYPIAPTYLHTVCATDTERRAYFSVGEERCASFVGLPEEEYETVKEELCRVTDKFFAAVSDAETTRSYLKCLTELSVELCGICPLERIYVDLDLPVKGSVPRLGRALTAALREEGIEDTEVTLSCGADAPSYKMATHKALYLYLKKITEETSEKKK